MYKAREEKKILYENVRLSLFRLHLGPPLLKDNLGAKETYGRILSDRDEVVALMELIKRATFT